MIEQKKPRLHLFMESEVVNHAGSLCLNFHNETITWFCLYNFFEIHWQITVARLSLITFIYGKWDIPANLVVFTSIFTRKQFIASYFFVYNFLEIHWPIAVTRSSEAEIGGAVYIIKQFSFCLQSYLFPWWATPWIYWLESRCYVVYCHFCLFLLFVFQSGWIIDTSFQLV